MEKLTVNGKVYPVKELTWKFLVILDKEGIDVERVSGVAALNMFVAYCGDMTPQEAEEEINAHVLNGGNLNELVDTYNKALTDSGFFRRVLGLSANKEEEVEEKATESKKESTKAKKASE